MSAAAPALRALAPWLLALSLVQACGESEAAAPAEEPPARAHELLPVLRAANAAAIRLGELAETNARAGRVRALGVLAQQDHRFANEMVAEAADELDLELAEDGAAAGAGEELAQRIERIEGALRGAASGEVEAEYLRAVVELTSELLARMRAAHREADDEYEDLLEDLIPLYDQHLQLARLLQEELGLAAGAAAGGAE